MLRLLAVFLPLFISFLFEACSKQGSALLPEEIIVNASELPGPIQEWKTDSACERCLTINLDNPGEGCDLDYCANVARDATIEIAMSNNFGFGGTNGTLVMKKI